MVDTIYRELIELYQFILEVIAYAEFRYHELAEQAPVGLEIIAVLGFWPPAVFFVMFFWNGRGLSMAGKWRKYLEKGQNLGHGPKFSVFLMIFAMLSFIFFGVMLYDKVIIKYSTMLIELFA